MASFRPLYTESTSRICLSSRVNQLQSELDQLSRDPPFLKRFIASYDTILERYPAATSTAFGFQGSTCSDTDSASEISSAASASSASSVSSRDSENEAITRDLENEAIHDAVASCSNEEGVHVHELPSSYDDSELVLVYKDAPHLMAKGLKELVKRARSSATAQILTRFDATDYLDNSTDFNLSNLLCLSPSEGTTNYLQAELDRFDSILDLFPEANTGVERKTPKNIQTCVFCNKTVRSPYGLSEHESFHVFELFGHKRYGCAQSSCTYQHYRVREIKRHFRKRHRQEVFRKNEVIDNGQCPPEHTRESCLTVYQSQARWSSENPTDLSASMQLWYTSNNQFGKYYQSDSLDCTLSYSDIRSPPPEIEPLPPSNEDAISTDETSSAVWVEKTAQLSLGSDLDICLNDASSSSVTIPVGLHMSSSSSTEDNYHAKLERKKHTAGETIISPRQDSQGVIKFGILNFLERYVFAKKVPASDAEKRQRAPSTNNSSQKPRRESTSGSSQHSKQPKRRRIAPRSNANQDDEGDPDEQNQPPAEAATSWPHARCKCVFFLADPNSHPDCAPKRFKTLGGLRSHIDEAHIARVICGKCPEGAVKYRDNGRLKEHLKKAHNYSDQEAEAYPWSKIPKPSQAYPKHMWEDFGLIFEFFCPGIQVPDYHRAFSANNVIEFTNDETQAPRARGDGSVDENMEYLLSIIRSNFLTFLPEVQTKFATCLPDGKLMPKTTVHDEGTQTEVVEVATREAEPESADDEFYTDDSRRWRPIYSPGGPSNVQPPTEHQPNLVQTAPSTRPSFGAHMSMQSDVATERDLGMLTNDLLHAKAEGQVVQQAHLSTPCAAVANDKPPLPRMIIVRPCLKGTKPHSFEIRDDAENPDQICRDLDGWIFVTYGLGNIELVNDWQENFGNYDLQWQRRDGSLFEITDGETLKMARYLALNDNQYALEVNLLRKAPPCNG